VAGRNLENCGGTSQLAAKLSDGMLFYVGFSQRLEMFVSFRCRHAGDFIRRLFCQDRTRQCAKTATDEIAYGST